MFPYEDSEIVSVCTPRKEITIASSISVHISNWYINGKVFTSTTTWKPKLFFLLFSNAYLSVSAVMLCKQFLAYTAYIDGSAYAIHKHSSRSQHISVLTTCTFLFRQVCTIEPSFFKAASGMHPRPFEGRHLVWNKWWICNRSSSRLVDESIFGHKCNNNKGQTAQETLGDLDLRNFTSKSSQMIFWTCRQKRWGYFTSNNN